MDNVWNEVYISQYETFLLLEALFFTMIQVQQGQIFLCRETGVLAVSRPRIDSPADRSRSQML